MEAMLRKLEDIQNTQNSLMDKMGHVITDMFNEPDKDLEKAINDAHEKASATADAINAMLSDYEERIAESKEE